MSGILPVVKFATGLVASVGVSKVVGDVVKNNVTIVTKADAVKVGIGSFVLGTIIVDAAQKQVDARVSDVANFVVKLKNKEATDEEAAPDSES